MYRIFRSCSIDVREMMPLTYLFRMSGIWTYFVLYLKVYSEPRKPKTQNGMSKSERKIDHAIKSTMKTCDQISDEKT